MDHTEQLTRYTAGFVDELAAGGLTDVVISPGSRSTPLAMTFAEYNDVKTWVILDERSAAFFALGLARKTKRAVALVCTSGTAAANYFPAIVEAYYSRVPLIVLTADRPHELRDVGAPQAIDQIRLYGKYVKWFQEMALPEASVHMLHYVRSKAARAVYLACEGNAGPVHLNFPFREPLMPDFSLENVWGKRSKGAYHNSFSGAKELSDYQLEELVRRLHGKQKGLIVCGPQTDQKTAEAIAMLSFEWGLPVLADPLSQMRAGTHFKNNVIEGYDAFLRNETIRRGMEPDFIIRFGAMPVSKAFLFYVQEHNHADQYVVENHQGYREPAGNETDFIFADPDLLCSELIDIAGTIDFDKEWLKKWQDINEIAKNKLTEESNGRLTEGEAVRELFDVIPRDTVLYAGNSMAIRDIDTFFMTTQKRVELLANRGTNGIDGVVSSALGAAAAGRHVTLVIGDMSFFHDLNGLLAAKHYRLNMTVLLMNNNGGGIFSFLPQAADGKHFEALFGTPLNIDFSHAAAMYGASYVCAENADTLKTSLDKSYAEPGLHIIELKTDRAENTKWHRSKWQEIEDEIFRTVW
jgi:2-succinyl-5-enolpyruvyl-6-hydroxy-3-cyclohexene-1-carboxylate synthase